LAATRAAAAQAGGASVALVFDPPPVEVLRSGVRVPRLAPLGVSLERITAAGIDHSVVLRFDDELRALSAADFVAALAPAIDLRALVMTPHSAFGRDRGGTLDEMRRLGDERGFSVGQVEPEMAAGLPISSSRVREALAQGDIERAAALLGRPPLLSGVVVSGDRRGRDLGYPTANLAFDYLPAMPALGIYVGSAAVPGRGVGPDHPALVSIGVRPTFHREGRVLVEVFLLDYDGDLYGAQLSVQLLTRLREERRFDGVDALVAQMRRDEAAARRFLGAS
jgi:riboflavin kinase/FMN adenylyltransferase